MATQYLCKNERRRAAVRRTEVNGNPILNGIDYLEVSADQKTLTVYFIHNLPGQLNPVPPPPALALTPANVAIAGGVRIQGVRAVSVSAVDNVLTVTVNTPGDFSTYTFRLVQSPTDLIPPSGFDPQLSEVDFSFKVECPSDFDCRTVTECPPEKLPEPEINYLAKDYASFRRLMLDRLSIIMPDWRERNPADVQVALVELLAYVGDRLSYFQDAVATEAYLGTAHQRTSIRRHARLLDYLMHDGCNARTWVCFEVQDSEVSLPKGTRLLTRGLTDEPVVNPIKLNQVLAVENPEVFETLAEVTLHKAHNEIKFYTWSDTDCCLPRGAIQATLINENLLLKVGDVLIFEEVLSPTRGIEEDADPTHRHAVRLTRVEPKTDPLNNTPVIDIEWDEEDALPFPLCLSAVKPGNEPIADVSVARGNVVLVDHGMTISQELDPVPTSDRYRPRLKFGPLTQQGYVRNPERQLVLFDPKASASDALRWEMRDVRPQITLAQNGKTWKSQRDLLRSDRFATEFVVETASNGIASLRFGDNVLGQKPAQGTQFTATYRVGNGVAGNVGANAITRIVFSGDSILRVWNPLPAKGGTEPESIEQVRLFAPQAFRTQERAVTEADYAEITQRHPKVQKATANLRWTGSWYTAFVTIDRKGGKPVDADFQQEIRTYLERYRLAGYDLEINGPVFIPLDMIVTVCVKPGYFRSDVKQSLLKRFSNREEISGRRGFFHPDNFTFGQPVYLSQIYQAAMEVAGVAWVEVIRFQRWGKAPNQELENGVLNTGALEVIRLDNDPNFPENGKIEFVMQGGL